MRAYISYLLLLTLVACAPKNSNEPDNLPNSVAAPAPEVLLEAASVLTLTAGSGAFGNMSVNSVTKQLSITNQGNEASELTSLSLSGANAASFSLVYSSNCGGSLLPNASCIVKINFNAKNKTPGSYAANLNVGSLVIPLSANVVAPAVDLRLQENGISITSVSFGSLERSQVQQKILTVKNYGIANSPALSVSIDNASFSLLSNSCAGRILAPAGSCSFRLSFSATNKSAGSYTANLNINSNQIAVQGEVVNPLLGQAGGIDIEASVNNAPKADPLWVFGSVPSNSGFSQIVAFKNSGSNTSTPLNLSVTGADAEEFLVLSNTCQDRTLAPGASCSFRLGFSAIEKDPRYYQAQLNFSDKTFNVAAEALDSVECPADSHREGAVCVRDPRACAVDNGTALEFYVGMAYGPCTTQSCDSGYHLFENACDLNVLDCSGSISHSAVATQSWNGSAYDACALQSCQSGYHANNNQCDANVISCSSANATAASQTWNGSSYGSCVATACESGYAINEGACVQLCPSGQQTFYYTGSDQTFTVPFGCNQLVVDVYGGGGSGTTHVPDHGGFGGGGGGFARSQLTVTQGTNYTVTVGRGAPAAFNGDIGGTSSFGGLLSASGGGGQQGGGWGGSGSGGNLLNYTGGYGASFAGFSWGGGGGGAAGPSGNGGGGVTAGPGGGGGGGLAGAGGGYNNSGSNYGGGGSGGSYGSGGGNGAPGVIVVNYSRVP